MCKWFAVLMLGVMLAVCGCKIVGHHDDNMSSSDPKKMSIDACPHCPGVQTATADGKCPECGMKAAK
jgi:hypothetical protein